MIEATVPVPAERAARYRIESLWDDRRLADGVEAAARLRPDAIAVVGESEQVRFEELASRIHGAARRLRSLGLGPGTSSILITGNTIEGVIAYHALLRVGATAVLLDRRCGPSDVRLAIEIGADDRQVVVCTATESARLLEGMALEAVTLEDVTRPEHDPDDQNTVVGHLAEPDRDAPAVILFTSGTTGRPKAVIHSLNTLAAGTRNMAHVTRTGPADVVFLVSPLTSITGVMQMHLCADQHATLALDDHFDAELSLDRVNALGVHLLGGAPVILERLIDAASRRPDRRLDINTVALGGAMLPRPLLARAHDEFGMEICRVYGSSEAPNTTGSLPDDDHSARLADDGALLEGTEVRVGSQDHPAECLLRGPALFLGYVDPEDNADAFEDGWFRTGDAVEVNDGRLSVVGRLKEIVNRNGLKISLSEVDEALHALPGMVECGAFSVPDPDTGERLAVAVRPRKGVDIALDDVVAHLRATGMATRKLPEQLVTWNDPLPRTPSGKVVRPRLAAESAGRPEQLARRVRDARDG